MVTRGLDAGAAAAWAIGRAIYAAATPRRSIPRRGYTVTPRFDARPCAEIAFDNREYLRALAHVQRAEERSARQRDEAIIRALAMVIEFRR